MHSLLFQRMEEKFSDTSTYVKIQKDPTQEIRQEIIVRIKKTTQTDFL